MHFTWTHQKNTRDIEGVFLNSGYFLKRRNTIPMIVKYRIIKIVNDWGRKSIRDQYGK